MSLIGRRGKFLFILLGVFRSMLMMLMTVGVTLTFSPKCETDLHISIDNSQHITIDNHSSSNCEVNDSSRSLIVTSSDSSNLFVEIQE